MEYLLLPRKRHWFKASAELIGIKPIQTQQKKVKKEVKNKGAEAAKTFRKIDDITKIIEIAAMLLPPMCL